MTDNTYKPESCFAGPFRCHPGTSIPESLDGSVEGPLEIMAFGALLLLQNILVSYFGG
jgi:hypothetical protein